MKPGLELDILIAEKVFGHTVIKRTWGKQKQYCSYTLGEPNYNDIAGDMQLQNPVPDYSTDIKCAWEIVEKINHVFDLTTNNPETEWMATFGAEFEASGESAPHAICLATLKMFKD